MPGITKGFKLTGGPPSNAGQLADSGTINDTYAALRSKSSSINKIPGAQMILDAKKYAAEEEAKTLREKAEWDAKGIAAKYDYYSDSAQAKGNSAMVGGALSAFPVWEWVLSSCLAVSKAQTTLHPLLIHFQVIGETCQTFFLTMVSAIRKILAAITHLEDNHE